MKEAETTSEAKEGRREKTLVGLLVADVVLAGLVTAVVLFVAVNNKDIQGSLNGINQKLLPQDSLVVAENAELRTEVTQLRNRVESLQHDNAQLSKKFDDLARANTEKTALGEAPSSNDFQQPAAETSTHKSARPSPLALRGQITAALH